jgi:AraC family transcriptional regulator
MQSRLEMVVGGRRRAALPNTPDFTSRASPSDGFFMEGTRLSPFELPDHWIPFYGVGLQLVQGTGKRFFYQDGRHHVGTIENGDSFVIAPQELRRYRLETAGGSLIMVSIEPLVLQEMMVGAHSRNPFELTRTWNGQDLALTDLVLKLRAEVTSGYPAGSLYSESLYTRLAEELIQRYSIGRPRLDQYRGGLSGARLRRALEYIDEHLNLNLNGNAIADVAGLSKYHFGKAVRQSTGMSLHGYVLARRIRRSQELLMKSDLPPAAVAGATGFSNQSHLTSVFSTRIGISPGAYRQTRRRVKVSIRWEGGPAALAPKEILKIAARF